MHPLTLCTHATFLYSFPQHFRMTGGCLKGCGACVVFLAIAFPLAVSFMFGGWTSEYHSAPHFKVSDIAHETGVFALVTGANTGIGKETALALARAGRTVFLGSRSLAKGEAAKKWIEDALVNEEGTKDAGAIIVTQIDLADLSSIATAAAKVKSTTSQLDLLILNAGVMKSPGAAFAGQTFTYGFEQTAQGFEYHIGVNHIGHFYLTQLLDPELRAAKAARVISVSSAAEVGAAPEGIQFEMWSTKGPEMPSSYEDGVAYGQSKLANILFAREYVKRMQSSGAGQIQAYSLHPGLINTELSRYMENEMDAQAEGSAVKQLVNTVMNVIFQGVMFSPRGGALTQLYCATQTIDPAFNGGYFVPVGTKVTPTHPKAMDDALAAKLWAKTEDAIANALAKEDATVAVAAAAAAANTAAATKKPHVPGQPVLLDSRIQRGASS